MNAIIIEIKEAPEDCYHCDFVDIETGWCKYAEIFIDHRTKPGKRYAGCPIESMPEYERLKKRDRAKKPDVDDELKPCPFCGRKPTLTERKSYSNKKWYRIICLNSMCIICPSTAEFEDKEDDIRAWNRRTEVTE